MTAAVPVGAVPTHAHVEVARLVIILLYPLAHAVGLYHYLLAACTLGQC